MGNKPRVFVAVYRADGPFDPTNPSFYWALIVEPKKHSSSEAIIYNAQFHEGFSNEPDSHGWRLNASRDIDPARNPKMLGRALVGKIPPHVRIQDLEDAMAKIPLPSEEGDTSETCRTWTMAVVAMLQRMECADLFDLNQFEGYMTNYGSTQYVKQTVTDQSKKIAFVQRKFP